MIDRTVILSVVWVLGLIAFTLSSGIVWIAAHGQQIDAGLSGLDGTCIGAVGGLLTSLHKNEAPAAAKTAAEPAPIDTTKP